MTFFLICKRCLQIRVGLLDKQALKPIVNTKKVEGTHIREHMVKMIEHFNVMKILRIEIDGETKVAMVLETLPDSLKQFKLNYTMNKMLLTLPKIMKKLQIVKGTLKNKGSINMVSKDFSKFSRRKRKDKGKSSNQKQDKEKREKKQGKKPKEKCFF